MTAENFLGFDGEAEQPKFDYGAREIIKTGTYD
jgi:hypothetical protein